MRGKKVYLILALIVLTTVSLFILSASRRSKSQANSELLEKAKASVGTNDISTNSSGGNVETMAASMTTGNKSLTKGESYEFEISFNDVPKPYPTAMTLILNYDPAVLKVESVDWGDLWTGANVLENKVDNDNGHARYSAGQDFGADTTGKKMLGKVKFTVLSSANSGKTTFDLASDSAVASAEDIRLIYLDSSPLVLNIQ